MFETLDPLPPDPILGVSAAFRRDTSPLKVDLGVGVYRVNLAIAGKDVASQTFNVIDDLWLAER